MKVSAPPRDWLSTAAGVTAAVALAAGLAWMVFGPSATRPAGSPWQLVWVNIVRPAPIPPPPTLGRSGGRPSLMSAPPPEVPFVLPPPRPPVQPPHRPD